MKKISLVSNGYRILSVILSAFMILLWYCICFLADQFNIGAIIFSTFVVLFCLFVFYLSFTSRILISDEKLIIIQVKKHELEIKKIIDIYTSDKLLEQNIIFILTSDKTYKFTGYNTLTGWEKNLINTKRIVKELKQILNLNNINGDQSIN